MRSLTKHLLILMFLIPIPSMFVPTIWAWGNGGYSVDPSRPDYGTHDWIVEHAKNWLPIAERKWIDNNLNYFLYGTEYPDNSGASYKTTRGYGDQLTKHHNYYDSSGSVTDASAAGRAAEEYVKALLELNAGRNDTAAIYVGSMTHYIVDIAVFGHVMTAETHHSDYENYVGSRTPSYNYGVFESYLVFDGKLVTVSAYDASISLGRNTLNDDGGIYTASWMDTNYDWNNPAFRNRCGESLNLATNYVADVLHTLVVDVFGIIPSTKTPSQISCSVSSTSITIGSSITVSGSVTPARSGVIVALSYTMPDATVIWRKVTTTFDSKYSDTYTPPTLGSWSLQASWEGDSTYSGATSPPTSFTVLKIPSTISCSVSSYSLAVGGSIIISGSITPIHSGVGVTISYKSDGSWNSLTTVPSSFEGHYSYSWSPAAVASYQLKASWEGDATYNGAASDDVFVTVTKISTTLSCSVSPFEVTEGSSITASGSISPVVSGVIVILSYKKPDSTTFTRTATTGSSGSYSDTYKPEGSGEWGVTASWTGDSNHNSATSQAAKFRIIAPFPLMLVVGIAAVAVIGVGAVLITRRRPKATT